MPEWMDWDGWRWVSLAMALPLGFYIGWDLRAFRARLDAMLERNRLLTLEHNGIASRMFVEEMASMTDPSVSGDPEEELMAWAAMIRKAKHIAGDLSHDPDFDEVEG